VKMQQIGHIFEIFLRHPRIFQAWICSLPGKSEEDFLDENMSKCHVIHWIITEHNGYFGQDAGAFGQIVAI
jgi:hypothetical protein